MIEFLIQPGAIAAKIEAVAEGMQDARPVMMAIGEYIMAVSQDSFKKSASPDGEEWAANSQVTLINYLAAFAGTSIGKNDSAKIRGEDDKNVGKISKKGEARLMKKRPLQGVSGDLARQFSYFADALSVVITNSMIYAAMMQFGGRVEIFPHLWGDIPARRFMPIDADGKLIGMATDYITEAIRDYIEGLMA